MRIAYRTGGGRGVYELAGTTQAGLSQQQLLDKEIVLEVTDLPLLRTGVVYTTQGGKPRLEISGGPGAGAVHIQRQIAALLLLPMPVRQSMFGLGRGADVLAGGRYRLEAIDFSSGRVLGDSLILRPATVTLSNEDATETLYFGSRFEQVRELWANADALGAQAAALLDRHQTAVTSGGPLSSATEADVAGLIAAAGRSVLRLPQGGVPPLEVWPRDIYLLAIALLDRGTPTPEDEATLEQQARAILGLGPTADVTAELMRLYDLLRGYAAGAADETVVFQTWSEVRSEAGLQAAAAAVGGQSEAEVFRFQPLDDEEVAFPEGRVLYAVHRRRERSSRLTRLRKEQARQLTGRLACEACGFDFEATYGPIGRDYIECHHVIPVSEYAEGQVTRPEDLALVCGNCHRILHRRRPWLAMEDLAGLLRQNGQDD